ncbi:tyrosine-type recombinase/integrase [Flavobacterium okayamense]|uniref:Tyr recombinase domain-containing protein n=1 Tax=Flavobacterium okayamense TaxID=2830782 RepID=A0ABN6I1X0_9FLAO|nr:tyrosine-type recombinase/integrase [Flavobacterium okayamense]BCY29682.1 hypothetical protein KK2020170_25500 [Flavobacterium okayamense]
MKLKLPKNSLAGIKVYCNKCKKDNPKCKHHEFQSFRFRLHVAGSKSKVKTKVLNSKNYDEALAEAIEFKNLMIKNDFQTIKTDVEISNEYSVVDAILKYNQFLNGDHRFKHLQKNVSVGHRTECIRFCEYFANTLKKNYGISTKRINTVNQLDVANFYEWAENHYAPKTFNKCMGGLKSFFEFLIDIEGIEMKNPFKTYVAKPIIKGNAQTITKKEFEKIINSIELVSPNKVYKNGVKKNMYYPFLGNAFKLFLLTGGRREEVVDLKWNNIHTGINGVKLFIIKNLKVERSNKSKNLSIQERFKYIPINEDLFDLLKEMGYEEFKNSNNFILYPERKMTSKTIMDKLSKSFTHYKEQSNIEGDVSLKNLRKTYLSWVNSVMMKDTKILSNHSSDEILKDYYLDPTIMTAVEKAALEVKIFGT